MSYHTNDDTNTTDTIKRGVDDGNALEREARRNRQALENARRRVNDPTLIEPPVIPETER